MFALLWSGLWCVGSWGNAYADEDQGGQLEIADEPAWPASPYDDGVSCGAPNRGALYGGVAMPRFGHGFVIPDPWWARNRQYGTRGLVGLVMRAAAQVKAQHPGGVLGVADISAPGGGKIRGHRSHQSGRDVDLLYYALHPDGQPFAPDGHMPHYSRSGMARYARAPTFVRDIARRYFDLARNWTLVKAMLTDEEVEVDHIFVSTRVRRWLLTYAREIGEPEYVVASAARVLRRPRNGEDHNDHMHVRIACSSDDITHGRCRDVAAQSKRRHRRRRAVRCPARSVAISVMSYADY